MSINDITLTAGMRNTLGSLQNVSDLFDRTQSRLATGKKVNSALDDPINFFAAKAYTDRASDLTGLKDSMNEAIQTIKAADSGVTAIEDLLSQAKSIANSALATSDASERSAYSVQFNDLLDQIDDIAGDASYKGTNLINGDSLTVNFNEDSSSSLAIMETTFAATAAGGLSVSDATNAWVSNSDITAAISDLDAATAELRTQAKNLATNLSVVQTRLDFTSNMVNTLTKGAENLTLADMNEEGANLLMLQTRQSLSSTSLSLASQAAQSVLRLF